MLPVKGTLSTDDIDRARGNCRAATFVDGKLRWLDENGQPGEGVNGNFDFIKRGNMYTLFPSDDRPTSTASRRKRITEEREEKTRLYRKCHHTHNIC
jgi:hypothetical protein